MPGNVANAAPIEVLPELLCAAFERAAGWRAEENEYPQGDWQARSMVATPRYSWRLVANLPADASAVLLDFYLARAGETEPFYFYDPYFAGFAHDPTGVDTDGRFTVRFSGGLGQPLSLGRAQLNLELIQLA
jgi:hypothetical protein